MLMLMQIINANANVIWLIIVFINEKINLPSSHFCIAALKSCTANVTKPIPKNRVKPNRTRLNNKNEKKEHKGFFNKQITMPIIMTKDPLFTMHPTCLR